MAGVEISSAYVGIAGADVRSVNSPRHGLGGPQGPRDHPAGHRTRARGGAVRGPPLGPRDPARHPAGVPGRRAGGDRRPARHARQPPGGGSPPGHRQADAQQDTADLRQPGGIEVLELVFEGLATAEAVLTHDERELGVLMIDHRLRDDQLLLFADGEVQHSAVLGGRRRALHQRPRHRVAHPLLRGRADQDGEGVLPGEHGGRGGGRLGAHRRRRQRPRGAQARAVARSSSRAARSSSS